MASWFRRRCPVPRTTDYGASRTRCSSTLSASRENSPIPQVSELAGLVRQSQETIDFWESQLRSAEDERSLYRVAFEDFKIGGDDNSTHTLLVDTLFTVQKELLLLELEIRESLSSGDQHLARGYAELNNQLVSSCVAMCAELSAELLKTQMQAIQLQTAKTIHDGTTADPHAARAELESTRKQLGDTSNSLDAAKAREIALTQEVKDIQVPGQGAGYSTQTGTSEGERYRKQAHD